MNISKNMKKYIPKKISVLLLSLFIINSFTISAVAFDNERAYYFAPDETVDYNLYRDLCSEVLTYLKNDKTDSMQYFVYSLIMSGALSSEDTAKIIENGYFSGYIDDFKKNGVLDKTYRFKGKIEAKENISRTKMIPIKENGKYDKQKFYGHIFENLDTPASITFAMNIIRLKNYLNEGHLRVSTPEYAHANNYIYVHDSGKDKEIAQSVLNYTTISGLPGYIDFIDENNQVQYGYVFDRYFGPSYESIKLGMKTDDSSFTFEENDIIPSIVEIRIHVDDHINYNIYNGERKFLFSLTPDEQGFISFKTNDLSKFYYTTGDKKLN